MAKRGYPRAMNRWANAPAEVDPGSWVSQPAAAERLGVSMVRIAVLIANEHLSPATDPNGEQGVTAASLETEARWRDEAGFARKVKRMVKDCVRWI